MKVEVYNEYDNLKTVMMGKVNNFSVTTPINETQKHYYLKSPPNLELLIKQQNDYVKLLKKYNIDIEWVEEREDSPNQLNTRDVAFALGNDFIVCKMKKKIRINEHLALSSLTNKIETPVIEVNEGIIEGGDVLLNNNTVYLGVSERTDKEGEKWLRNFISDKFNIITIHLRKKFLHLDTVFNILSKDIALVYTYGIEKKSLDKIRSQFKFIEINNKEQFNLGTNVISIGNNTIISDSSNVDTNKKLKNSGFKIETIDFSEIKKIGGSFRCSICPLIRKK